MTHYQFIDVVDADSPYVPYVLFGDGMRSVSTADAHKEVGLAVGAFMSANVQGSQNSAQAINVLEGEMRSTMNQLDSLAQPFGYGNFVSAYRVVSRVQFTYETQLSSLREA